MQLHTVHSKSQFARPLYACYYILIWIKRTVFQNTLKKMTRMIVWHTCALWIPCVGIERLALVSKKATAGMFSCGNQTPNHSLPPAAVCVVPSWLHRLSPVKPRILYPSLYLNIPWQQADGWIWAISCDLITGVVFLMKTLPVSWHVQTNFTF